VKSHRGFFLLCH